MPARRPPAVSLPLPPFAPDRANLAARLRTATVAQPAHMADRHAADGPAPCATVFAPLGDEMARGRNRFFPAHP